MRATLSSLFLAQQDFVVPAAWASGKKCSERKATRDWPRKRAPGSETDAIQNEILPKSSGRIWENPKPADSQEAMWGNTEAADAPDARCVEILWQLMLMRLHGSHVKPCQLLQGPQHTDKAPRNAHKEEKLKLPKPSP